MDNAQAGATTTATKFVTFRIWRQEGQGAPGHFEEFRIPYVKGANVVSSLMEIQRNPVNSAGKRVPPIVWDAACLEEVCGSCAMVINGKVRMACSSLVDKLEQPITLEPMKKFPVIRDLTVNRDRMFEALKRVKAWVQIDGTHNLGPGPRQSPTNQAHAYVLSTCMTCGCCLEACPQITQGNLFIGPAAISQARLFNMHPSGAMNAEERVRGLMGPGGIDDCGKAQNCVRVCPKEIPLTTSIATMNREVAKQIVKDLFSRPEERKSHAGPG